VTQIQASFGAWAAAAETARRLEEVSPTMGRAQRKHLAEHQRHAPERGGDGALGDDP
jgi:hypothetical protein